jgi:hypothetical protein
LYCKKKDGGLGIPRIETLAVSISLKTGLNFMHSPDPAMRALIRESKLEQRLQDMARMARIGWPIANKGVIDQYKARQKKKEITRWASLKSQGKAVKAFESDKIANAWLMKPQILKPSKYITALKFRANVAADKVALARAKIRDDVECRKCHVQKETLGHVLGQCTYTKKERINRHDEIKDFILKKIVEKDREAVVTREPTLQTPEGVPLKPYMVVKNHKGVFVVDVTVRHENRDYLRAGRRSKIEKYSQLLPDLQGRLGGENGEVLPIVIGTRGAIPKSTVAALENLNIKEQGDLLTISLIFLRKSISIYTNFMDYNAHLMRRREYSN